MQIFRRIFFCILSIFESIVCVAYVLVVFHEHMNLRKAFVTPTLILAKGLPKHVLDNTPALANFLSNVAIGSDRYVYAQIGYFIKPTGNIVIPCVTRGGKYGNCVAAAIVCESQSFA